VVFQNGGKYSSGEFGSGTYSTEGNQVVLDPSAQGMPTRVFIWQGRLMQGTIDGWPCTLTQQ
jgi:hypothetical protein